ncbi:MAG: glucuronate isomerase [Lachnospiraceae bacterium]|nr:glucuronate isomerase [Lachnospiraceae bacterium]
MRDFMDKDFVLLNDTAVHLFHDYSEKLPIIDYHCHISPREIYENRRFDDIGQVWLGGKNPDGSYFGDHYKWRLMRSNGIPEKDITDPDDPYKRFEEFAGTLEMAIGNPMYHWCNLELRKYFNVTEPLKPSNAKKIWDQANDMLKNDPNLTVRGIIEQSNVYYVGTTDDPVDTLEWHEKIAADDSIKTIVRPSYRPDKALNIDKDGFVEYIGQLAHAVNKDSLNSAQDVIDAVVNRAEFFAQHGCVASDHGIDFVPYKPCSIEEADQIFKKAMSGQKVTREESEKYQTVVLLALGRAYKRLGIAMEIHYSCSRNVNRRMFKTFGPDTGFDMITQNFCADSMASFLSDLDSTDELPKTILFSLHPGDNEVIDTVLGAFQKDAVPGYIQHGPAWWFNDTKSGMEEHMKSLANLSLLGNFVGMLTDSRSFLSYTRHDYFRRIMCNQIGQWVENGEYPNDEESLKKLVEGISFYNSKRYFGI